MLTAKDDVGDKISRGGFLVIEPWVCEGNK
jgi:hypothetical protein